ncbi:hypothetical protein ILYODFUR_022675 [Ilyodon furcidens]|uniref:Uncharacterized protein n=1 Tax=Ilyodon furcidens TaxID=33524 RepID=A0ABV0TAI0_9TELE
MFQSFNSVQTKALLRSEKNEKLLMEENKKCKREIANLVEKNFKLEKDNGCLKEDLKMHSSSNNKIKELQETTEDLQKQQQENAQSLSRIQEQNTALQKEIKTLCDKNAVQTLWREQQARELEGFDKLKKEAQIITSDISELKHQNKDLKAKDQQKQNKMRDQQNLLQNERTKSKNVQEALNNEKLSIHHLSEKAQTLPALNNKLQSLQSEKDGLLGELNKSRKQAKSFEKDIEMLKEEIQSQNLKSKELLELLQIKTSVSDNLQRELQSKDVHLASLEEEAVKACKIIDGMQLELEKLYLEIENDRERNTLNQGNQCLKKEVKGREGNEQKLAIQVSTFKNQIKHVEGKLLNVHMYLSKSEKGNASLKELNMTLDHEISMIKAELEGNKSKNQSLDDQLEQMRKQMEETEAREKEKLSVVHSELIKVKDTVSLTEVERQRLAKELEDCKQNVLQYSGKLNQIENEVHGGRKGKKAN